MTAAPTYPHDIPSLCQTHPALPVMLGPANLDQGIAAGAPIDAGHLNHARTVARLLRAMEETGNQPNVTEAVARSAELRASAVEAAHANAQYGPGGLLDFLQAIQNQLNLIENALNALREQNSIALATAKNNRILARNFRVQSPTVLSPLQKTVPGHGVQLAQTAAQDLDAAYQAIVTLAVLAPDPAAPYPIGSTPPMFQARIEEYGHAEILRLIIFYNDNFGIQPGDSLSSRKEKFRCFLTEF